MVFLIYFLYYKLSNAFAANYIGISFLSFHLGVSSCKNVVEISLQQIFKGPYATMTAYILYNAKKLYMAFCVWI